MEKIKSWVIGNIVEWYRGEIGYYYYQTRIYLEMYN